MRFAGEHQMCMFGCVLFLNHKGSFKYTGEKKTPNKSANPAQALKIILPPAPVFQTGRPQILRGGYDDRPFFDGAFTLQFSTQRTPEARTLTAT